MVRLGEILKRRPVTISREDPDGKKIEGGAMTGKVVYIHPGGRFFTLEFQTAGGPLRESFQAVDP